MTLSVSVLMALYKGNYFCLLFRDIFAILFKNHWRTHKPKHFSLIKYEFICSKGATFTAYLNDLYWIACTMAHLSLMILTSELNPPNCKGSNYRRISGYRSCKQTRSLARCEFRADPILNLTFATYFNYKKLKSLENFKIFENQCGFA